ncbi:ACT domain-containing protein [Microbulbifer sp. EKSA008]|uniref:ACT domain-containing protein n=1 Tax=unclassified Microbulbifer TaxID=2619833 RepID=UPI0039B59497
MKADLSIVRALRTLYPKLHDEIYVFCQVSDSRFTDILSESLCFFREGEGMSVILPQRSARQLDIAASAPFRQITLQILAGLDAVRVIPVVAQELMEAGIDTSVVSTLHRDHIFVPDERAEFAVKILRGIRNRVQYS